MYREHDIQDKKVDVLSDFLAAVAAVMPLYSAECILQASARHQQEKPVHDRTAEEVSYHKSDMIEVGTLFLGDGN